MTYTMTDTLIIRLRRRIEDENADVFTNDELNDFYDEAGGDWNLTLALVAEDLLWNAAKRVDYKANESEEKRSQAFIQLEKLANRHRSISASESAKSNQFMVVGIKRRPPRNKTSPFGDEC